MRVRVRVRFKGRGRVRLGVGVGAGVRLGVANLCHEPKQCTVLAHTLLIDA